MQGLKKLVPCIFSKDMSRGCTPPKQEDNQGRWSPRTQKIEKPILKKSKQSSLDDDGELHMVAKQPG